MSACTYDNECDPWMRRNGLSNCQCDIDTIERQKKMHSNLSDQINADIAQSERDGGVWLKDLRKGDVVTFQTRNRTYTIKVLGEKYYTIEGHPDYCPIPTSAMIAGSTWGGSMLKMGFIGRNMHLEFRVKGQANPITTTAIKQFKVDRIH